VNRQEASALFAQWLGEEHPDIYAAMYAKHLAVRQGLGDLTDFTPDLSDVSVNTDDISVSDSATNAINEGWDTTSADESLVPIGSSSGITSPNVVTNPTSGSSGGILSSLSSVGNFLTSPAGLQTLGNVVAATISAVGSVQVAQTQMAIVQAQAQRAAAGIPPAPISYAANGAPVYVGTASSTPPDLAAEIRNGTAQATVLPDGSVGYSLTNSSLNSLLNVGSIPWYIWAAAGGILLIALSQ
jgi:hypothetical protein